MTSDATIALVPIPGQKRALVGIALSQLLVLTIWFSAAAVAPQLREQWSLSVGESSWLTLAVQIGFVLGAFAIATSGLADSVAARRLFTVAALSGAVSNGAVIFVTGDSVVLAYVARFATGVALAEAFGWQWAFPWLALGPILGILAMVRLRRSSEARLLAGGIG